MKFRIVPLLALLSLLLLSACSSDDKPESVTEDAKQVTAVKRIADDDFELRLVVNRFAEDDNAVKIEAGLRYVGDRPKITIEHGEPLFIGSLVINGERVGGLAGVNAVAIRKELTANEWLTQDILLPTSKAQIKQLFAEDGQVALHAGFSAKGYANEPGSEETLTLAAGKIPH